ncbi:YdaU family protein [Shimia sp. R9_2]|uniref:DUF1376 domain-containing protein n=1 Tax=Shimia sp. R9_2 TaxID=2821112 RepID=UPI001ADC163D|nr:DUF1376 domain-containing protein [Shimia sp. R9_2]MBO9398752.1 YdaU family protein [Shimia sp. R9_2]
MSILHVAFYPSDWLAGTRGLSDVETGVYITLIARMYEMAGPLERDDNRLYRLCGSKSKASFVKALNYLISDGKIIETEGGLFNDRVQKEIEKVTEKSVSAKQAADARWKKKTNKNNGPKNANASNPHMQKPCQLEPELEKKEEPKGSSKKKPRGDRLPEDWVLPKALGDWAVDQGLPPQDVRKEAAKFIDYWHSVPGQKGVKLDWPATWRNWIRKRLDDLAPKRPQLAGADFWTGGQG